MCLGQIFQLRVNPLAEAIGNNDKQGIPGTVGGGLKMNAGCFGAEIKDILVSIQAVDKKGNVSTISAKEINFDYRDNDLSENLIFLSASFIGKKKSKNEIIETMTKLKNAII